MSASLDVYVERIRKVTKDFLKTAGEQIQVEVIDNMGADIGAGPFRDSTSGALSLRAPRNRTDKLRFQTNNLSRALTPGERGNIFKVTQEGSNVFGVEYGIDYDIIKYARIHEFGGTIKHPGGTHYRIVDGRAVFVNKADGRADGLPTTKPHNIKIPARPYLRPGFEAWLKLATPRYLRRIEKALEG